MKNLSLANALRYMFPSMVVLSYFYILYKCDQSLVKQFTTDFEPFKSLSVIWLISFIFLGSILYFLYRPLYNAIALRLHDSHLCRHNSDNYRTYLKKRYENDNYKIGTPEATQLWIQIRDKYLKDRYTQEMKEAASGIHLIYLAGFIALLFAIWMGIAHKYIICGSFLGIMVICFLSAFFLDRVYEGIEVGFLYSLGDNQRNDLDSFVRRILQNRFHSSNTKSVSKAS